jgi:HAE1 family hydrophobic/amphiphilic exporter-1
VNVSGRDVGSVARDVEQTLAGMQFENAVTTTLRGPVQTMRSGMDLLGAGLLVAGVLVYLVLTAQFRSFVDPLIIMLARALMGGMVASTVLTLLLVPCVDTLVHQRTVSQAA